MNGSRKPKNGSNLFRNLNETVFSANEEVHHFMARSGCKVPGCRGTGHVQGPKFSNHHTMETCPYAPDNLDEDEHLPDRFHDNDKAPEDAVIG